MEQEIRKAIISSIQALGITESVDFVVEHPSDISHGDYATNVVMALSKKLGKNPRELAEEVVAELEKQDLDLEKIEIAGPGFINFYLTREFFKKEIIRASGLGGDWGKNDSLKGQKVLVEYTDPNPFKEIHIGTSFYQLGG